MPASRPCSTSWSAPRCRSSRPRCRPRAPRRRHRDPGQLAGDLRRYPRHLRAQTPARTRDGRGRLGRGRRCRYRRPLLDDAACGRRQYQAHIAWLKRERRRAVLVVNKVDLVSRERLPVSPSVVKGGIFRRGVHHLGPDRQRGGRSARRLVAAIPEGPFFFPEDQLSDLSDRSMAAEITREQVFLQLHQELPYGSTVETEGWEGRRDGSVKISQTIYRCDSQKAILSARKALRSRRSARVPPRARAPLRPARPSLPFRQGTRGLDRRPRALRRARPRLQCLAGRRTPRRCNGLIPASCSGPGGTAKAR